MQLYFGKWEHNFKKYVLAIQKSYKSIKINTAWDIVFFYSMHLSCLSKLGTHDTTRLLAACRRFGCVMLAATNVANFQMSSLQLQVMVFRLYAAASWSTNDFIIFFPSHM